MHTYPRTLTPESPASGTSALRTAWERLLNCDFTRPRAALVLTILYIAVRLPNLNLGYGADADAWRVAITGRWLWRHGEFYPSRLPGYPVHELLSALLLPGGWVATNAATMLVSLAGVFCFAGIVRRRAVQPAGLLTLTFAFTPLLWNASTVTMDYMWALTGILAAYLLLLDGRHTLAGVALGLAAGCRLTSLFFLGPFLIILLRERNLGASVRLMTAALLTAVLAFAPVWLRYGTRMLDFADWRPTWGQVARTLGVEAGSLLTAGGLGLIGLLSLPRLRSLPDMVRRDGHLAAWIAATLMIFAVYMRLPLEEGYLIAGVPFALLAMARVLRRPLLLAACALIVAGGFIDVYTASEEGWRSPTAALYLRPTQGRVLVDRELRAHRMEVVREARRYPLPDKSVLTMGYYYPIFAEYYHDELELRFREPFDPRIIGPLTDITEAVDERNRAYVWLMNELQVRRYRRQGFSSWTMDYDSKSRLKVEPTLRPELDRFSPR